MRSSPVLIVACGLLLVAPAASAGTNVCGWQTSFGASACVGAGTFQGGDGSCEDPDSWRGGAVQASVAVGGSARGVSADNTCYAFDHPPGGYWYSGSQLAVHAWSYEDGRFEDDGAYLNTGSAHTAQGDHEYCYVTTLDENGESRAGPRLDCPSGLRVPVLLTALP